MYTFVDIYPKVQIPSTHSVCNENNIRYPNQYYVFTSINYYVF